MHARKILIYILFGAFLVSIIFSFYYRISPTVDAKAYTRIARNMVAGLGYIEHIENTGRITNDDAIVRVGPGYEFFLAGLYLVTGGQNLPIVWVAQALLRVLTAFFIYKIALLLFSEHENRTRIALLAAGIIGFFPDLVVIGGMLLAETLFLTLFTAAVYFSLLFLKEWLRSHLYLTSILWGLAALVRPTAIPMALLLAGVLAYRKNWASAAIVLLPTILFIGSWSARNSLVYGRPLFTTTAGSYALWVGNNAGATGGYDKTPQIQELIDTHHSIELSKKAFGDYFAFLIHRPFKFIELQFRKAVLYFSLLRPMGLWIYLADKPIDRVITLGLSITATALLFIFGFAGAYHFFHRNIRDNVFLFGMFILQPFVVIPTYVETRYRYPLYIFLALFASFTISLILKRAISRKVILWVCLLFFLISVIDVAYSQQIFRERIKELRSEFILL